MFARNFNMNIYADCCCCSKWVLFLLKKSGLRWFFTSGRPERTQIGVGVLVDACGLAQSKVALDLYGTFAISNVIIVLLTKSIYQWESTRCQSQRGIVLQYFIRRNSCPAFFSNACKITWKACELQRSLARSLVFLTKNLYCCIVCHHIVENFTWMYKW